MKILLSDEFLKEAFGGNSGYVGYSMSVRAAKARKEGKFPKTDFKNEYRMSDKVLGVLLNLGFVLDNEWHHTSKYGNRTVFYSFCDEPAKLCWEDKSDEIKKFVSKGDSESVRTVFDDYIENYNKEYERKTDEKKKKMEEYSKYVESYKREHDRFDETARFTASNGCTVDTDGLTVYGKDGNVLTKSHGKSARDRARSEYNEAKYAWKKGLLSFDEYFKINKH